MTLAFLIACSSAPKHTVGAPDGQLAGCPETPNCVSTQADASDEEHHIAPISVDGPPARTLDRARQIIEDMPRTQILSASDSHLHATFTTAIFRWVDDVELVVDAEAGLLHFRSASRIGHSDMGVNRKRMEAFRAAWQSSP